MPRATTPAQYALILIDMLEQSGYSRTDVLEGTRFTQSGIASIGARVDDEDFDRLTANALALTGNQSLGLDLGQRINLSAHAVLGQAFMTCNNLAEVIELFLRYQHLLSSNLNVEFEVIGERGVMTVADAPMKASTTFSYELLYASVLNTLRGLLNRPDIQLAVELPYEAPAHAGAYRAVLGPHVRFGAYPGRITFAKELLDTPLPSSNAALRALYEEECARLLADLEEEESVAEQTLRLLRKLEGQYPQMPQVAQMFNFSPRTYRRRLQQEGQAFQDLLDRVRAEHATRYLRNTSLPIATIAYLVGFNDASNFRRAYTRWTGRSPREVRIGQEYT